MSETIEVSVVGGSGYVGGELLRLLLFHPQVSVRQVTSARLSGRFVYTAHPTLRGTTSLQFTHPDALDRADVLFLALPHGEAAKAIDMFADKAERIIDCSADFRLRDTESYEQWYGTPHPAPEWLSRFVYGLPERNRAAIADSRFVSGVGCNATVTTLALAPLVDGGLLDHAVADVKVGSSEAGAKASPSSHHPERSGSVRSFKPTGHRHQAEVVQELGRGFRLDFSVTSVELVRGALVTAHCFLKESTSERDLWTLYRKHYAHEPFVRLVSGKSGIHRYPEPKLLAGSNYCDIGFATDELSTANRVVTIAAIDNLMKGAAGTAVQCMNIMLGFDETSGLGFPGLHPI
ncbi:MAG: N-acetyl-gamma-glutamyl-phosphate reductase [Gemmatimonadetes bacterium]|nr:N-acetyl-gamma-glutamyl-phosphate reductase [Gemmatimonadota bacterium]